MATAAEDSPPETGSGAVVWLTKLLSIPEKFTSRINITSNKATRPPLLPISSSPSQQQQQQGLNRIIKIMQEQELGKLIITIAVPVAAALLISGMGQLLIAHFVVVGLMTGCMAIWNGILFRTTFPRLANIFEQVGISLVLLSLHAHFSSFLPKGFSWLLWLCGALYLVPFIVGPIVRGEAMQASEDLG